MKRPLSNQYSRTAPSLGRNGVHINIFCSIYYRISNQYKNIVVPYLPIRRHRVHRVGGQWEDLAQLQRQQIAQLKSIVSSLLQYLKSYRNCFETVDGITCTIIYVT